MTHEPAPVVIAAGGTGGHVFPALAVADVLREHGVPVVWFGTHRGLEATVVPNAGYPIHWISVAGLRGKNFWGRITGPLRLLAAVVQSVWVVARLKPRAVLGMGGYVTGPVGVAAKLNGVPLVLHEQNAVAGFTNRLLSRFATTVLSAMPNAFDSARNAITVGNPLRRDIEVAANEKHANMSEQLRGDMNSVRNDIKGKASQNETLDEGFHDDEKPITNDEINTLVDNTGSLNNDHVLHVLVVGGSQGAQVLNNVVPEVVKGLNFSIKVVHQTGFKMYETIQDRYASHLKELHDVSVQKFIDNMKDAYLWADIVVCRSGAMTVSEIAAMSLPSVLVPFPHAMDDHQTKNAKYLEEAGASVLLSQDNFSVERLSDLLTDLHFDRQKLQRMGVAARRCHQPDAATKVAQALIGNQANVISSNHGVSA